MKFIRANKRGYTFHLLHHEKLALFKTIALYPLVPEAYQQLSKTHHGAEADENQRLLEASLAEQRKENRQNAMALTRKRRRFRKRRPGVEITFKRLEVEWLLQVLNDVRIGSWLMLGEPEQGKLPAITRNTVRYLIAMEIAGAFESLFLFALGVAPSAEWAN